MSVTIAPISLQLMYHGSPLMTEQQGPLSHPVAIYLLTVHVSVAWQVGQFILHTEHGY